MIKAKSLLIISWNKELVLYLPNEQQNGGARQKQASKQTNKQTNKKDGEVSIGIKNKGFTED